MVREREDPNVPDVIVIDVPPPAGDEEVTPPPAPTSDVLGQVFQSADRRCTQRTYTEPDGTLVLEARCQPGGDTRDTLLRFVLASWGVDTGPLVSGGEPVTKPTTERRLERIERRLEAASAGEALIEGPPYGFLTPASKQMAATLAAKLIGSTAKGAATLSAVFTSLSLTASAPSTIRPSQVTDAVNSLGDNLRSEMGEIIASGTGGLPEAERNWWERVQGGF